MRTVALIPARGGSKRLPGKNLKLLLGKPLLAYTLEAALICPLLDAVYVSTEDPAIAHLATTYGIQTINRPQHLATDEAQTDDVVRHFLDVYQQQHGSLPQTLVLLQPTSPLRSAQDIEATLNQYVALPKPASVVSVCPVKPVSWQGGILENAQWKPHTLDREGQNYLLNGAIYCTSAKQAYEYGFLQSPIYPYIMSDTASVDIDTETDFQWATFLLQQQRHAVGDGTPMEATVRP